MKILSIQEAYRRKFERQQRIKELEYHAAGHCVHIGKLSPGCYGCFVPDKFKYNILTGRKCNLGCFYCPSNKKALEQTKEKMREDKVGFWRDSLAADYRPSSISFSGGGEPLLYLNVISEYMAFLREIEEETREKPWYYLYTNGLLADHATLLKLREMGFDEIRFHLGASNFSRKVYKHMEVAARYFEAVTVETPAWPPHRKQLFEMLPLLEEIGIKHLNVGEIMVNKLNYKRIAQIFPNAEIYYCFEMHLDDGGLVYDLMEEALKRKYSYSILDCNGFVKSIQRTPAKWVCHEGVEGLCAEYRAESEANRMGD